jgi:hypothetical protein
MEDTIHEFYRMSESNKTAPIVIGAIGGSGTRVVARILSNMQVFIGKKLNEQLDNLYFTYFFKYRSLLSLKREDIHLLLDLFVKANLGPPTRLSTRESELFRGILEQKLHSEPDILLAETLYQSISSAYAVNKPIHGRWGWKEPNSHFIIPELIAYFPQVKYIHVVRNGLDMAYSKNQNQPRLWGPYLMNRPHDGTSAYSLSYWCAAHRRVLQWMSVYPDNMLIVKFEDLCTSPVTEVARILDFCGISYDEITLHELSKSIIRPATTGRHMDYPKDIFDPEDIRFVKEMGFPVQTT